MTVYVAWGYQGVGILGVYASAELALAALKEDWADYGEDPDEVTGRIGDLDGMYFEEYEVCEK